VRTKGPEKQIQGYKLPLDLIRRVKEEAASEDLWPAHVVERRLRHSFAVSPDLPQGAGATAAAAAS
jgi:hypothetical protein